MAADGVALAPLAPPPAAVVTTQGPQPRRQQQASWLRRLLTCCAAPVPSSPQHAGDALEHQALSSSKGPQHHPHRHSWGIPLPHLAHGSLRSLSAAPSECASDFHDARSRVSQWSWYAASPTHSTQGHHHDAAAATSAASASAADVFTPAPAMLVKEPSLPLPTWMPQQPLMFMDRSTRFVPVPKDAGLSGFWAKVPELSTPNPLPIDILVNANFLARKAHESISGIKVSESADSVYVKVKIQVWGLPNLYTEVYRKDGSSYACSLRRDVRPGKSLTRIYYTEAGDTIFVSDSVNMLGSVDYHGEEVVRVSEDGTTINFRMYCHSLHSGRSAEQYFTGRKEALPVSRRGSPWSNV